MMLIAPPPTMIAVNAPADLDYATVRTAAIGSRLTRTGRLIAVAIFPTELGGEHSEMNRTFLPPSAMAERQRIIDALRRDLFAGLIDTMDVDPIYRGDSVIPTRLLFRARSSRSGKLVEHSLDIW